jgi:hypothetical protein
MAKSKSFGTAVTIGGTAIGGLTDISITGADVPMVDITTHDSTAREFVPGLKDFGSLELSGKFDPANSGQDALRAAVGTSAAFVVTLPNGSTTISFSAIVGPCTEDMTLDGTVDFSCSCKVTGDKTYSAT